MGSNRDVFNTPTYYMISFFFVLRGIPVKVKGRKLFTSKNQEGLPLKGSRGREEEGPNGYFSFPYQRNQIFNIYIYIERERQRPNIRKHGVLSSDTFYIKRIEIFLSVIFLSATSNIRTN